MLAGVPGFSIHGKVVVEPLIIERSRLFTKAGFALAVAAGSFQVSIPRKRAAPEGTVIETSLVPAVAIVLTT